MVQRNMILCVFLLFFNPSIAVSEKIALVIGNGQYTNVTQLPNPVTDAKLVSATLNSLGFEVVEGYDLDQSEFSSILFEFATKLEGADVAALYYAGHGIQYNGKNYLIATNARLDNPFSFNAETISLDLIINTMEENADVSLVFLDACRVNPFLSRMQILSANDVQSGLATVEVGSSETIVMYAAALNGVAVDGLEDNSPFALALARHLPVADTEFGLLMRRVIRDVRDLTGGLQSPELLMATSLEVYLNVTDDLLSRGSNTSLGDEAQLSEREVQLQVEQLWRAGSFLHREGLDEAAYVLFDSAQKLTAANLGDDSLLYGQANNHLIGALTSLGRIEDAAYAAREAIRVNTIYYGPDSISVATDRANLASRLRLIGKLEEARGEFLAAIAIFEIESEQFDDFRLFASSLDGYSQLLAEEGNMIDAISTARRALETYQVSGLTRQIDYGWILSNVAYMELNTGNQEESCALFRRSVNAFENAEVSSSQSDHANSIRMVQESCS